jgi:hypothetical protein
MWVEGQVGPKRPICPSVGHEHRTDGGANGVDRCSWSSGSRTECTYRLVVTTDNDLHASRKVQPIGYSALNLADDDAAVQNAWLEAEAQQSKVSEAQEFPRVGVIAESVLKRTLSGIEEC